MDLTQSGTTVTGTLSFGAPPTISGSVTGNDVKLTFHDEGCVNELSGTCIWRHYERYRDADDRL